MLFSAGCAHAIPKQAGSTLQPLNVSSNPNPGFPASVTPAFLDAPNLVTVWMDQPTTASSLMNHVSVRVGTELVPVTRVQIVQGAEEASGKVDKSEVVLAGTFQAALGGSNWSTDDAHTRMHAVAPGVYDFQATLPKGGYEYKIACGGTWDDNYGVGLKKGGDNILLTVPADNTLVLFRADFNEKTLQTSLDTRGLTPTPVAAAMGQPAAPSSHVLRLTLGRSLTPADIVRPLTLHFSSMPSRPIYAREVLSTPAYFYGGNDLGATYAAAATTFKVWSPVSSATSLLLYKDATSAAYQTIPMSRSAAGVWSATVFGNLDGVYYQYAYTSYGAQHIAPDIYGRAASEDLQRSMVIDLARTDPANWSAVPAPTLAQPTDAVVYEIHTRDFTIDPSSGVPDNMRGKYLGLIAPGTHVPGTATPTGLDYLKQLGVTDIHLLPIESIANSRTPGYNWGYETDLFDVPESRYATDPSDPTSAIRDVKTMVAGLHQAHIGLVMDVVYNHAVPVSGDASPFWAAVPYYYFRTGAKGDLLDESGVGNSMDDAHPMVRKFVIDSLTYWETQYHVDGFRFDLLGIFTPQTVAAISQALHKIRPDILLYGEPWTGGGPIRFGKGAQRGLGVAVFNDNIRNLLRGDLNGTKKGFALGGDVDATALQTAINGSPDFTQAPTESMNYVSIHDDMSIWDKITQTLPGDDALDRSALKLAGAMVILSQGVPILEGGSELGRTKQGNPNSYNAGDSINHFDWQRGLQFQEVSNYYRGLIALRQAHPAFRCATAQQVSQTLKFLPASALPANTVAFTLDGTPSGDPWRKTLVIFHGASDSGTITLPPGHWHLAVIGEQAQSQGSLVSTTTLTLAPLSAAVLYQSAD